jgi:hypothetical protein
MERIRPGALTAIAIGAIVLGSITLLVALAQIASLAVQGPMQQASLRSMQPATFPGQTAEQLEHATRLSEAQRRMMERAYAIQRRWAPFQWAVNPVAAVVAIVLILGGAWCLRGNPAGRRVLAYVCAAAILFSIVRDVGDIMLQLESSQSMSDSMAEFTRELGASVSEAPNGPSSRQLEQLMTGVTGVATAASVGFGAMWLLLKLGFFVTGLVYLTRGATRRYFEGAPP